MAMTDGSALRCLIALRWLNVWNGCCRVGLCNIARAFAYIAACVPEFELRAKYWR